MSEWRRVSKAHPCPICERADWCGVSTDGSAAVCMRVESGTATRNGGWLHRLTDDPRPFRRRVARVAMRTDSDLDFGQLAARYAHAASDAAVTALAGQLGVSADSLRRLCVGWDGESWTFPMADATGRVVGIRRRLPSGRKLSGKGGREGLFVPADLSDSVELFIAEGPTDCAALLTLGLHAVGRPSCRGGVDQLVRFVRSSRPSSVVILADGDAPGHAGAHVLAVVLRLYVASVRVFYPPDGVDDARAWVKRGATAADVRRSVDSVAPIGLTINTHRRLG